MSHSFFLVNQWANRFQGHGRSELQLVRKFLSDCGYSSKILSSTFDFGDVYLEVPKSPLDLVPRKILRGELFRLNSRSRVQRLLRTWIQFCNQQQPLVDSRINLVLTSSTFFELLELLKLSAPRVNFYCRITHFDLQYLMNKSELRYIEEAILEARLVLAFETSRAFARFSKLSKAEVKLVPPAQGLTPAIVSQHTFGTSQIGLIWPLTSYATLEEVESFLKCLPKNRTAIIRLPHRIRKSEIGFNNPNWKFMPHDLSEEEFLVFFEGLQVCILPHKQYDIKGSGLAFQLISMGIPVVAQKDNAFVEDLSNNSLMILFDEANPENIPRCIEYAFDITDSTRKYQSHTLNEWVYRAWKDFLF